jgi:DNA replication initiation complex subunit (GINS family)
VYGELYAAWKREIENPALQPLPADFYAQVSDYVKRIKEETGLVDKKTLKGNLLEREMRNVNRIVKELLRARYRKLVRAIGETGKIPSDLLTSEEVKMCEDFLPFAEAYRRLIRNMMEGQTLTIKPVEVEQLGAPIEEPLKRDSVRVVLRFLKAIPSIIGSDMKTYGPFATEDVASLPADNAKILVKQGLAVVVEVSS